ncbi:MAG: Fe-S oxidoreductase [Clostridiales bacterium]|jgi:predicted aldo/keto reductase-like oxidoreductase|nr:Fe-S oxidoreductase [Clostridiales bacterium]
MPDTYLGESIGKLGFGCMRLPKAGGDFDYAQINRMVDAFLEQGFTYFDTAFVYTGSEEAMRKTLIERHKRDKYTIASKLSFMVANTPEDMQMEIDTSLRRLGTDYLDFYLLHGLGRDQNVKAEKLGGWDFVRNLKAKGKIRHYGFSFHDTPEALDEILTKHPDAEFVQLQINYLDWDSDDVQSRKCYETARKHNKPIVIMEPVKGGLLASGDSPISKVLRAADPGASVASWAVRFAASLDGIITVLSGMSSMEQMEDNIKTVKNLKPLDAREMKVLEEVVAILKSIPRVPCTGCRYCVDNCPQKINIPAMMDLYSNYLVYNTTANSDFPFFLATKDGDKPSSCIACRVCEGHCPQHIEISDILAKMAPLYEK